MSSTPADTIWRLTVLEGRLWATGNGNTEPVNGGVDRREFTYYREEADGSWTRISSTNSPAPIRAVETGLGAVAVGSIGRIWTRFPDETWRNLGVGPRYTLVDLVDFQGLLVAVGRETTTRAFITTSTDGLTWTPRASVVSRGFRAVAQGAGRLVAVGDEVIRVSEDGVNWSETAFVLPGPCDGVAFGNGRFVVIEQGRLRYSRDAHSWSSARGVEDGYQAVTFAYGGFVAVNATGAVMGSVNGETWIQLAQIGAGPLFEVIAMDRRFVVAGGGGLMARSDVISPAAPAWVRLPRGWEGRARARVVLEGEATEASSLAYQWYREGIPLAGQTAARLVFESIQPSDSGTYWLVASNAAGTSRTPDCAVHVAEVTPSDHWQVLRRMDQDIRLARCARGPGRFLATTEEGEMAVSSDGVRWSVVPALAPGRVRGVYYLSSWYIAAGEQGFLARSPDGKTWTRLSVGTQAALNSVAFHLGNGWVAVGDDGELWRSTNLQAWSRVASGVTNRLNAVVAGVNEFVAVGEGGVILTSPNGQQWTRRNSFTTATLKDVGSGGGFDVAVGASGTVLASAGGDWTFLTLLGLGGLDVLDVNFFGDVWSVMGERGLYRWRFRENRLPPSISSQADATFGRPERLSALTSDASMEYAVAGNVVLRGGTYFWSTGPNREVASLRDIAEVAGRLVAVGDGGAILHSSTGSEWEVVASPGTALSLAGVAGDVGRGVVVGEAGTMLWSTNGSGWRSLPRVTTNHLHSVAAGGGRFVASGSAGTVLASEDGERWQLGAPLTWWHLQEVVYHEGRFWTASFERVFQSTNGLNWVTNRVQGSYEITDLTFLNGSLVVLDSFLPRRVSDAWRAEALLAPDWRVFMRRLDSDGETLVGVGLSTALQFSRNGMDWFQRSFGPPLELHRTRLLRGSLYAVGAAGTIARSAPWSRLSASPVQRGVVSLHPSDGRTFRLEHATSADGASGWQTFEGEPVVGPDGRLTWKDDGSAAQGTRFYRAVMQE
ncbi:MAG: hypothetical protein IT580_09195 [Verrucomicrobiales bacterium]|nr:hypothetical protein [Verrucomicrobiales bacterium]